MITGSSFLLLLVFAIVNVLGFAQGRESRPRDPGAAVARGNSPTTQSLDYCDPVKKRAHREIAGVSGFLEFRDPGPGTAGRESGGFA